MSLVLQQENVTKNNTTLANYKDMHKLTTPENDSHKEHLIVLDCWPIILLELSGTHQIPHSGIFETWTRACVLLTCKVHLMTFLFAYPQCVSGTKTGNEREPTTVFYNPQTKRKIKKRDRIISTGQLFTKTRIKSTLKYEIAQSLSLIRKNLNKLIC